MTKMPLLLENFQTIKLFVIYLIMSNIIEINSNRCAKLHEMEMLLNIIFYVLSTYRVLLRDVSHF